MFFPATVTLKPCTSRDSHHKPTYGTSQSPSCRYVKKTETIDNDVLTVAWLQFPPATVINKDDLITLPDSTTAPVTLVIPVYTPNQILVCVEVYLGKGAF